MSKKSVAILGFGEVGQALQKVYFKKNIKTAIKDLNIFQTFEQNTVLNICIPYTNNFIETVYREILNCLPKLVIIHSTVPIGTTMQIQKAFPRIHIVHSPIRGNHPKLYKSIKTFVKYIGSNNNKANKQTKKHFKSLGIKSKCFDKSEITEALKLTCTTFYGLCITWYDFLRDLCKEHDIDFSSILEWQKTYNKGYTTLKQKQFCRPILQAPNNKKIGGHCIISNAEILNSQYPHLLVEHVLKFK